MIFRRLVRPITKPFIRLFARYFVLRSEHEAVSTSLGHSVARLEELTIAQARQADAAIARSSQLDQSIAQVRQHAEASIAQLVRDIASSREQISDLRTACEKSLSTLDNRTGDLERTTAFDRQAIHDLGRRIFSSPPSEVTGPASVGVIVPSCDRPLTLERALSSLAIQTRKPNKVVVINDGREDVTQVVERFASSLNVATLKTATPRSGSSIARNMALDMLDTSLVAFLDDDNLMWPRWIEEAAAFLETDSTIDIVYGAQLRDAEASTINKSWFLVPFDFEKLKEANFIDLNQVMHRASGVRFNQDLRRLVDWDYTLRLIDHSPDRIVPVNAIASIYSTSEPGRISVVHWPPDLGEIVGHRLRGETMVLPEGNRACSCCGYVGEFSPGPGQRPKAQCPRCGSLERHRFLQLLAPLLRTLWIPETRPHARTRMIEVAPSHATLSFRRMFGVVTTVGADPAADGRMVDIVAALTELPFPSESADVALVLRVLEHIPDDRKAMAEILRVLRPAGIAVLQVPLSGREATDEEVLDSPEERSTRYGQADHVCLYGDDFLTRLEEAGLTCAAVSPRESMLPEAIAKFGLLPDEALVFAVRSSSAWAKERLAAFESMLRRGSWGVDGRAGADSTDASEPAN
ncbi:glycosyltransferase [Variovorax sp. J31P207]|uniref:glycosyltransferase n=1 Tax=Variovorax sp. J31P207 TaxID=3053510 RepID=UPI0025765C18|nr:glycosyltransferase [Variovorax sp. J31P207]MDM0067680.1 glycosyltransferase [Variovorax sp. J31P207]